jgi:hypothetical protein
MLRVKNASIPDRQSRLRAAILSSMDQRGSRTSRTNRSTKLGSLLVWEEYKGWASRLTWSPKTGDGLR